MSRQRTPRKTVIAKEHEARLGPGLHPAKVELFADTVARARLASGEVVRARVAPEVEPAFVEECLRLGRTVLLADSEQGPAIIGALQTSRALGPSADGTLLLDADVVRLRAASLATIEVGASALRFEPTGLVRMEGNKLVVDVSSLVRFLSARVELP
ncbi:MAG: hypothetical protein ABI193_19225 [Minicystis sp.]